MKKEGKAWGHGKHANMPTETVMKSYASGQEGTSEGIDDTMVRLDGDSKNAHSITRRQKHKSMY